MTPASIALDSRTFGAESGILGGVGGIANFAGVGPTTPGYPPPIPLSSMTGAHLSVQAICATMISMGLTRMAADVAPMAIKDDRPWYDLVTAINTVIVGLQADFPSL